MSAPIKTSQTNPHEPEAIADFYLARFKASLITAKTAA